MSWIDTLSPELPVLIAGATASGKSAMALDIAERQGGVIVNADALQVYDCWRVLSARPGTADLARAPHRLYGHISFDIPYSVGGWLRDIAPLLNGPDRPIVVGGTGLYFSALTEGLTEIPPVPTEIRAEGDRLRKTDVNSMIGELETRDPLTAAKTDLANPMRVQRAWEVLQSTGRGLHDWQQETPPPLVSLSQSQACVLERPKEVLNQRIESRFRDMIGAGALDEVRAMQDSWEPSLPSSRAIGARELIAYLNDEVSLEQAIEGAVIATRQFAKRQRTWFRNRMGHWARV